MQQLHLPIAIYMYPQTHSQELFPSSFPQMALNSSTIELFNISNMYAWENNITAQTESLLTHHGRDNQVPENHTDLPTVLSVLTTNYSQFHGDASCLVLSKCIHGTSKCIRGFQHLGYTRNETVSYYDPAHPWQNTQRWVI